MPVNQKILTQKESGTYARLTAPQRISFNHFRAHERISGYFENRDVPDFMGSDRLLKLDTIYGTIQLGYNPVKGQSFLFANIKASILDTAASRHQKELKEYQMTRALKSGTQNIAYTAKRRGGSAVILYKMENQPWSRRSVMPYLRRINLETLQKTMPFLDRSSEVSDLKQSLNERKSLGKELSAKMAKRKYGDMAQVRARQVALTARQNELGALLYRKDTLERLFFRKLNAALDIQKHEMFAYYRDKRKGGAMAKRDTVPTENIPDEVKDE